MEVSGKIKDYGDETSDKVCELCQTDNFTKQADGFCKDCEQFMCNACFRQHLRAKACRDHVMVDVDQSPRSSTPGSSSERALKCKQHGGETIKYFCRKHDDVGCGDCLVLKHNDCKAEFISKLSANFRESQEFKTLLSKIEQLSSANDRNSEKILENERKNTILLEKALGDIRQFRADINQYLDKVEANVISEAKAIMSGNKKLLAKLKKDCELLSTKIENINQALNVKCFQDHELFINTVENKPNFSEIELEITGIQSKCVKNFDFVPDEQLKDIVNSKKRLGRLVTTDVALTPMNSKKTDETLRDVSDKKDAGMKSASTVTVGTRVRDVYWARFRGDIEVLPNEFLRGTVTAVHAEDIVTVKWDFGGEDRNKIGRDVILL